MVPSAGRPAALPGVGRAPVPAPPLPGGDGHAGSWACPSLGSVLPPPTWVLNAALCSPCWNFVETGSCCRFTRLLFSLSSVPRFRPRCCVNSIHSFSLLDGVLVPACPGPSVCHRGEPWPLPPSTRTPRTQLPLFPVHTGVASAQSRGPGGRPGLRGSGHLLSW